MAKIPPIFAANLANSVYDLSRFGIDDGFSVLSERYGNQLDLKKSQVTKGRTGGPGVLKSRTAFGFVCVGKDAYKGHAFFVLRGTQYLADWLTNFNIGTSRSFHAQPAHDGFKRAFNSMRDQMEPFITALGQQGIHSVHCVGHSLGGALASVTAEYIDATTQHKPYLYTFGAPRVGLHGFADKLTTNLTPQKMFRVYHRTDIVPCIPFWPFTHAPTRLADTYDYFQPSPGDFPSGTWHDMGLYEKTVGRNNWQTLRGRRNEHFNDPAIESWLNKKSPVSFTVTNLEWVDKAINYVLKKVLGGLGALLTTAVGSALTLMDRLAMILHQGIDISKSLGSLVLSLVRKIMEILGMKPLLKAADATYQFIRNLFLRLSQRVSTYCQRVLDDVLVKGQSA
ncbi:lipase family protein [Teredinibacter turnerae]|uniref:lipase family protein n=1 Tax=Teredinibacter turnerae TaxID=2426 RepID=UPI0030D1CC60